MIVSPQPPFGAGNVIGDGILVEGMAGQMRTMRGADDPVGDRDVTDLNRLEDSRWRHGFPQAG